MTFSDKLRALAKRAPTLVPHLATEEATKTALVLPFISALGYDVFDPTEVVPEFIADVGIKKGEKVAYAIKREGEIVILIECKASGAKLGLEHASQLYRYFSVTKARIAILTNGVVYQFYSDLDEPSKLDARPFLILDLLSLRKSSGCRRKVRAGHRARPRRLRPPRRGHRPARETGRGRARRRLLRRRLLGLRKAHVSPALLILGDRSVQWSIKPMRSATELPPVAKDNGAKRALLPIANTRTFLDVSADISEHVDPIFFGDAKAAAMKILGARR